jgi:hypothetical protein
MTFDKYQKYYLGIVFLVYFILLVFKKDFSFHFLVGTMGLYFFDMINHLKKQISILEKKIIELENQK